MSATQKEQFTNFKQMLKTKKYIILFALALAFIFLADTIYKRVIYKDVVSYADSNNVSFNVAKYRLGTQVEIGELDSFLTNTYKESFSGLYIQHKPKYSVNLLFNKLIKVNKLEHLWVQKEWGNFVKVHSVKFSLIELKTAQNNLFKLISKLNAPNTVFLDIINNRVVLHVLKDHSFEKALLEKGLKLPKEVTLIIVKEFQHVKELS
jgi:hypothetical protein